MLPFSSPKDVASLPLLASNDHKWRIIETSYDDSPLIIRQNVSAKDWFGHTDLSVKLGFAIPLNSPNEGGLPTPEENGELNYIEDIILQEIDSRAKAIAALVLTTGTMREFVFYVTKGTDIALIHRSVQQRVSSHKVQCMAVLDPTWKSYLQFNSECEGEKGS
jgi:hypothetical protein